MDRFNLKKINYAELKEEYYFKIKNTFALLENSDDNLGINKAYVNIIKNIKTLAKHSLGNF
jgi:hypothetical protein